ncbi:uncharacterized protein LOC125483348 [Rhincodon typus]|uniref:uncharacterized protein LOC125483348 n=1 Tax=Rhincodon typus TaxID=259920 RepID=UPI00202F5FF2|nr:uncharacterized protein LOC125483348 [Rhincodon typus]
MPLRKSLAKANFVNTSSSTYQTMVGQYAKTSYYQATSQASHNGHSVFRSILPDCCLSRDDKETQSEANYLPATTSQRSVEGGMEELAAALLPIKTSNTEFEEYVEHKFPQQIITKSLPKLQKANSFAGFQNVPHTIRRSTSLILDLAYMPGQFLSMEVPTASRLALNNQITQPSKVYSQSSPQLATDSLSTPPFNIDSSYLSLADTSLQQTDSDNQVSPSRDIDLQSLWPPNANFHSSPSSETDFQGTVPPDHDLQSSPSFAFDLQGTHPPDIDHWSTTSSDTYSHSSFSRHIDPWSSPSSDISCQTPQQSDTDPLSSLSSETDSVIPWQLNTDLPHLSLSVWYSPSLSSSVTDSSNLSTPVTISPHLPSVIMDSPHLSPSVVESPDLLPPITDAHLVCHCSRAPNISCHQPWPPQVSCHQTLTCIVHEQQTLTSHISCCQLWNPRKT